MYKKHTYHFRCITSRSLCQINKGINHTHWKIHISSNLSETFPVKFTPLLNTKITKGYLHIFVCIRTRAVYLEFTSDLSAVVFLAAQDRFFRRHGIRPKIHSNCGCNFG